MLEGRYALHARASDRDRGQVPARSCLCPGARCHHYRTLGAKSRTLIVIAPAGLEAFFREMGVAHRRGRLAAGGHDGPVRAARFPPGALKEPGSEARLAGRSRRAPVIIPPMTDRGLPIVDGAPACPFVAFEDDRDGRGQAPDHRHRCFAEPRPAPRALAHQEAYCLSSAFPVCPTFQDWARREAATARAAQRRRRAAGPRGAASASRCRRASSSRATRRAPTPRRPCRRAAIRRATGRHPPPWAGDADGEQAEPPSFLAARPPRTGSDQRAADEPRRRTAPQSRGLAGSAADRLAGGYVRRRGRRRSRRRPAAYEAASYAAPVVSDPDEPLPTPGQGRRRGRIGRRADPAAAVDASPDAGRRSPSGRSARPAGQASPTSDGREAGAPRPSRRRTPPSCSGRPGRRRAATRRTRRCGPGSACPSFGGIPRIGVAAVVAGPRGRGPVLLGPMLLGIGGDNPGGGGAPARVASRPRSDPDADPDREPAPTPQVYTVARGDTMLKIAQASSA